MFKSFSMYIIFLTLININLLKSLIMHKRKHVTFKKFINLKLVKMFDQNMLKIIKN